MELSFEKNTFNKRMKSMLSVDFRRMFTMPLFYIMVGIALVMPILILVMTTMMDGTVSVNPQTGEETVMEAFDSTWQAIGAIADESSAMSMDLVSMCNINLIFFMIAVYICIFVSEDFRSGYAKNLFTVHAKKSEYIISKTLVGFVSGTVMLLAFFAGTMLGGVIAGLPFDTGIADPASIVMCMLAKIFLMAVFVAIYLLTSVIAKEKLWLSVLLSLGGGMLLFMMIPMLTPLNSGIMNVVLCLAGGVIFALGLGAISNAVLKKRDIL